MASAACALCASTAMALSAQTFTTLVNFIGNNGANPHAGLVQGFDGNLYGTTYFGGVSNQGTVFRMTPAGTLITLHSFCAQSGCGDGANPLGGLVQATNGNFYGTTAAGGLYNSGTVFKITPSGALTTLYNFCSKGSCWDGSKPSGVLIQATDGNFYGTTQYGGTGGGGGTVFRITPSGTLTSLASFCLHGLCTDGSTPYGGLAQGTDGNFYGTTEYGGDYDDNGFCFDYGCGTVFKMTPTGTLTKLYDFCSQNAQSSDGPANASCSDGALPTGALVLATDGNFYGITSYGEGVGTVFKVTPGGTLTTLYIFCQEFGCPDGYAPIGGLVRATDGNFYGTTASGGASNYGTVFEMMPEGSLTTLHSFDQSDGTDPSGALIQYTGGALYGTTDEGGTNIYDGTAFTLDVGLGPFVETQPTSGKVGAAVKILGTNLTGTTSVTFNGTAAVFTVVSNSLISTTVPAGATSGKVKVTKPHGSVTSNVPFRVKP